MAVILEAAARVLERRGLEGFNTNAVAEAAGVSIGSLYQYFPNKDSLTVALIRMFEQEIHDALLQSLAATRDSTLELTLRSLVLHLYRVHHRRPTLHRLLESEERRLLASDLAEPPAHKDDILRELQGRFRAHHASLRGNFADDIRDVFTVARALIDETLELGIDEAAAVRRTMRALRGYL